MGIVRTPLTRPIEAPSIAHTIDYTATRILRALSG